MNRRVSTILLFLLAGAIVNVAVAWGCALWIAPEAMGVWMYYEIRLDDRRAPAWDYWIWTRPGACRVFSQYLIQGPDGSMREYLGDAYARVPEDGDRIEAPGPAWSRTNRQPQTDAEVTNDFLVEDARGWPLIGLRCTFPLGDLTAPENYAVVGGFDIRSDSPLPMAYLYEHAIPLVPIWPGFAINTLFYAALLWLTICGPFALRRQIRRKRGRCLKCGYDLRGDLDAGCPECGWNREEG